MQIIEDKHVPGILGGLHSPFNATCVQSHEERVVFDFYDERSLKNATTARRGKMESNLRFIVKDKTPIKMSLDRFVNDVKVKQDLSIYLAESMYNNLGSLKSEALLSLHALSGCDTIGRSFGKDKDCLNPRWYLFTWSSAQAEKLCPTIGAFKQAVLRAHCQARAWLMSDRSVGDLPDPLVNGWELAEGSYVAYTTKETIAPQAILSLVKCGCSKSHCQNNSCKCFKANLVCTELCKCADACENMDCQRNKDKKHEEENEEFLKTLFCKHRNVITSAS
eukprot:gene1756-16241_t